MKRQKETRKNQVCIYMRNLDYLHSLYKAPLYNQSSAFKRSQYYSTRTLLIQTAKNISPVFNLFLHFRLYSRFAKHLQKSPHFFDRFHIEVCLGGAYTHFNREAVFRQT